MRLIKAQNTNLRNIYGKGIKYDTNDKVTVDSANVMRVPKGTTAQYTTTPEDGDLRFNTDKSEFEIVSNGGTIASIRTTAPGTNPGIVQQSLGNADGSSTIYGPLDNQDTVFPNPLNAQNILVFLENVFQISTTNYTTVQNPTATGTGAEVDATALTQDIEYIITDPGNTDFTLLGAADSNTGTVFTANASNTGVGTGQVRITGFYLDFTSAPPAAGGQGQTIPITVLHNFDK
jgi:hypothetical protein